MVDKLKAKREYFYLFIAYYVCDFMKKYLFEYDQEADAAYIRVRKKAKVHETEEINSNVIVDFDKNRKLIGIEIINFSRINFKLGKLIKHFESVALTR